MRKGALALALPFVALLDVEFAYLFLYKQASAPYFWRGILIVLGMRSLLVIGTWWRGPRWLLGTAVRISVALPLSPFVAVWLWWTTRGLLGPIFGDLLWSYIGPVVWFMIVLAAILWWPLVRSLE